MNIIKKWIVIGFILFSCLSCDQATKAAAKRHLATHPAISFANDMVRLQYAENRGAFLSLGSRLPSHIGFLVFVMLPVVFLAGMLVYIMLPHEIEPTKLIALSMIIGGGTGNLYDRIFNNGLVIDFMNIGIGSIRTGIFNVADVAIMIGCLLIFFLSGRDILRTP